MADMLVPDHSGQPGFLGGGAVDDFMRPGGSSAGPGSPGGGAMDKLWGMGGNSDANLMKLREMIAKLKGGQQGDQPPQTQPQGNQQQMDQQMASFGGGARPMAPPAGAGVNPQMMAAIQKLLAGGGGGMPPGGGGMASMGGMPPGGGGMASMGGAQDPRLVGPSAGPPPMQSAVMPNQPPPMSSAVMPRNTGVVGPGGTVDAANTTGPGPSSTQGWFEDLISGGGNKMPPGAKEYMTRLFRESTKIFDMKAPNYKGDRVANKTGQYHRGMDAMNLAGRRIMDPEKQYTKAVDSFLKPHDFTPGGPGPDRRNPYAHAAEIPDPVINTRAPDQRQG